jgi:hypothetical protein
MMIDMMIYKPVYLISPSAKTVLYIMYMYMHMSPDSTLMFIIFRLIFRTELCVTWYMDQ